MIISALVMIAMMTTMTMIAIAMMKRMQWNTEMDNYGMQLVVVMWMGMELSKNAVQFLYRCYLTSILLFHCITSIVKHFISSWLYSILFANSSVGPLCEQGSIWDKSPLPGVILMETVGMTDHHRPKSSLFRMLDWRRRVTPAICTRCFLCILWIDVWFIDCNDEFVQIFQRPNLKAPRKWKVEAMGSTLLAT